jgi:hypothetical protein
MERVQPQPSSREGGPPPVNKHIAKLCDGGGAKRRRTVFLGPPPLCAKSHSFSTVCRPRHIDSACL